MIPWYLVAVGSLAVLPMLAPRLSAAGLGDAGATWALLALPLGTLLTGPAWASAADASPRPLLVHRAAIAAAAAALLLLALPLPTWAVLGALALFAVGRAGVFPLADAATSRAVGPRYGAVRGVGSVGYIVAILGMGQVHGVAPLLIGAGLLLAAFVLAPRLPQLPRGQVGAVVPPTLPLPAGVAPLLLVALLNGVSLTTYDHLFALHAERIGLPPAWISAAIAWGVSVEVAMMLLGPRLLARWPPRALLVVAVGCGAPRFALTGTLDAPLPLAALQGLHGLQFGLFWVVAVAWVSRLAPPTRARTLQALLPAATFGVAPLLSLGLGGLWLTRGDTSALFTALCVPAAAATLLAARLPAPPPAADADPPTGR